jgi:hypothetical protein
MAHASRLQRDYEPPQYTPPPEDYIEITHSKAELMLVSGETKPVVYKFARQPRPTLMLTCQPLNKAFLKVAYRPSYWDLPTPTQATLLGMQLEVGREVTKKLDLPESAFTIAIHLRRWISGFHIHSNIMLPLEPYFRLFSEYRGKNSWDEEDSERREQYLKYLTYENAKWHEGDFPKVMRESAKTSAPPDL